jgi:hypothetical protein
LARVALQAHELGILTVMGDQFLMAALFDKAAGVEDEDAIGFAES